MSNAKITRQVRSLRGAVKKALGGLTGNRRLHAEGRREQAKADVGQAAAKVKDAFTR
jgi:uncharacterized protein YjbJ (UPF0337 family)